ncbi:MAG TPA: rhodanese-like domain-containing protein [Saprospiraceae bacterium]|nr:rhodanese-like domain-containing protein [Saprospiraceae bacterium]HPN70386.1 rhodanese-like domain-containing protein [Saprospiraceae bacterium]
MKRFSIFAVLALFISITSCAQKSEQSVAAPASEPVAAVESQTPSFKESISPAELKDMMANNKDLVVIDVRTPQEIAGGKIENALEINISDPAFNDKIKALDTEKEYVVYCKVGGRSAKAKSVMQSMGIKKVSNLVGGYDNYKAAGQ